jgi:GTP-binding protein
MLQDRAVIYIRSGHGGRGALSFHREKYVPHGGPDGGDGGRGGHVYFRVDDQLASLIAFRYKVHFWAENGEPGRSGNRAGRAGEDLVINVPPGTVIYDDETGELVVDLVEQGAEFLVARGGLGGHGNARFKTSIHQAPRIAELGEPGVELRLRLELKLIADVGLVGYPNAGKSTLLAAASAARPKIADYPFTTLEPNLGVVEIGGRGGAAFVMADIPGLIEGAAEGVGLGLEFLRHVERTRLLLHVIDGSGGLEGRDPVQDFLSISAELSAYSDEVAEKPRIIVINKLDIPETREYLPVLTEELSPYGEDIVAISAATGEGVSELMNLVAERLREIPERDPSETAAERVYTLDGRDERYIEVERLSPHHFAVRGKKIERTFRMTNFSLDEAAERFQRVLEASGAARRMEGLGIQPGDIVHIAGDELVWGQDVLDAEAAIASPPQRRRTKRQRIEDRFGDPDQDDGEEQA